MSEAQSSGAVSREARTLLVVLRRFWWFIVLVALVALGITYFLTQRQQPTYSASAHVLLRTSQSVTFFPYAQSAPPAFLRSMATEELYISTQEFRDIARPLNAPQTTVRTRGSGTRLTFEALGPDPAGVAETANAWANTYIETRRVDFEQSTLDEIEFLGGSIAELQAQYDEARKDVARLEEMLEGTEGDEYARLLTQKVSLEALLAPELDPIERELSGLRSNRADLSRRARFYGEGVIARVDQSARVPGSPISPDLFRNLLLGGALGALFATAAAFAWVSIGRRVESAEEITQATSLSTLAAIPAYPTLEIGGVEVFDNPSSPASAQYQALVTAIEFASVGDPIQSMLFTSAAPGDGKTTTAINVAALTSQYQNVLLIDGDMRRPMVHKRLGLPNERGLSEVLRGLDLAEARVAYEHEGVVFDVLPAGETVTEPARLLRGEAWAKLMADLFLYDLVVVDGPPVLAVTDALLLGAALDAQVLVTRSRRTRQAELTEAGNLLSLSGTPVIGVVANQDTAVRRTHYYYYGSETS